MIITIHQPVFLPWLGYFAKVGKSETLVHLDDVNYSKNGFINRNYVLNGADVQWITLPVKRPEGLNTKIMNCELSNEKKVLPKIVRTLHQNYKNFENYKDAEVIIEIIDSVANSGKGISLIELNILLLRQVFELLDFQVHERRASELNVACEGSKRISEICESLNADRYIAGGYGQKYLNHEDFRNTEIVDYKFIDEYTHAGVSLSVFHHLAVMGRHKVIQIVRDNKN